MENHNPKTNADSDTVPTPTPPSDLDLPAWAQGWLTMEELQGMKQYDNLGGALELKDFLPELESIIRDS